MGNDLSASKIGQRWTVRGAVRVLSPKLHAAGESVGELADTDQEYEAEAIGCIEDAADHPEKPVRIMED